MKYSSSKLSTQKWPKMAKIAPKLNKVSPKMAKIIHIWSKWRQVRETWWKSYCQSMILLATRLLGFTTFSWSAHSIYSGPALSGTLVKEFGFQNMLVGVAIICFAYSPFLTMLKDPPHRTEQERSEQEVGIINIKKISFFNKLQFFSILYTGKRPKWDIQIMKMKLGVANHSMTARQSDEKWPLFDFWTKFLNALELWGKKP